MAKQSNMEVFSKGLIKENPVLRLVLGTCPTLAVTTAAVNGIGMGVAATLVLVGSNAVISLLRNVIPDKVRIPAFITIIAAFVSIIQMLVKAFTPSIDSALGIYLPLIVVNCIILARAEMFASKNSVLPSVLDGLGMGIGFTAALTLMGMIRELLGAGSVFGMPVTANVLDPMIVFILPPGGFFVFGILIALSNKLAARMGKKPVISTGCGSCEGCSGCEAGQTTDTGTDTVKSADNIPDVNVLAAAAGAGGEDNAAHETSVAATSDDIAKENGEELPASQETVAVAGDEESLKQAAGVRTEEVKTEEANEEVKTEEVKTENDDNESEGENE